MLDTNSQQRILILQEEKIGIWLKQVTELINSTILPLPTVENEADKFVQTGSAGMFFPSKVLKFLY